MIDMDLFSELRTIYETTLLDPHTYRITIKMKDIIDGKLLREAVDMTMERYPYFRVCLYIKGDAIGFEENPAEVPVIHTKKRISLGGEQSSGHLLSWISSVKMILTMMCLMQWKLVTRGWSFRDGICEEFLLLRSHMKTLTAGHHARLPFGRSHHSL